MDSFKKADTNGIDTWSWHLGGWRSQTKAFPHRGSYVQRAGAGGTTTTLLLFTGQADNLDQPDDVRSVFQDQGPSVRCSNLSYRFDLFCRNVRCFWSVWTGRTIDRERTHRHLISAWLLVVWGTDSFLVKWKSKCNSKKAKKDCCIYSCRIYDFAIDQAYF